MLTRYKPLLPSPFPGAFIEMKEVPFEEMTHNGKPVREMSRAELVAVFVDLDRDTLLDALKHVAGGCD